QPRSLDVDVLQTHLATSDVFPIRLPPQDHLPELLGPPLVEWLGRDQEPSFAVGSQEVGDVADPNRLLPALARRQVGARCRRRLDDGRVDATVDKTPGLMVLDTSVEPPGYPRSRELVEVKAKQPHELARRLEVDVRGV